MLSDPRMFLRFVDYTRYDVKRSNISEPEEDGISLDLYFETQNGKLGYIGYSISELFRQ
jgi:hypothetical protein